MIRLGLRLALRGGREATTRFALIAAAVAIGVGLLLSALAAVNAVGTQNARYAWLETGAVPAAAQPGVAPDWWLLSRDRFEGKDVGRVDVAATGANSPVPPGIPALPGPGQFYASPALSRLLADTPRDELGTRYPGHQIGTIGNAALPAPNSLIIIIGYTASQLAHVPGAVLATAISTTSPSSCNGPDCIGGLGINAKGMDLVLAVVVAALLFPVLVFVATATRLSAARREQRFSAMRLTGATPRQVAVISAVESTLAAALGTAGGFGVFFALRPALAPISFTGAPFFVSDLSLTTLDVLLVLLGVPLGAAITAQIALRRTISSPLGVTRRVTPAPPRAVRVIPLLLGLGELTYFVAVGRPTTTGGQILAYLTGVLITMAGLVIAGPWLTMVGARLVAGRARRPAALVAARRLADNPQAGFRSISGLVLALFVTTTAIALITTISAYDGGTRSTSADRATLIDDFFRDNGDRPPTLQVPSVPPAVLTTVRSTPGVTAVLEVHVSERVQPSHFGPRGLVSCADLAKAPALGRCPAGAHVVQLEPDLAGTKVEPETWPAASTPASALAALPVRTLVVVTDGSQAAVEHARTVLLKAYPRDGAPETIAEAQNDRGTKLAEYRQLANVVIIASLPIAGCTLAVSVVAGLSERRRPFSLLRLAGAPLAVLRRIVVLESAVPLLVAAAASVGTGFLASYLFLRSQLSETLQSPGTAYYALVGAGVIAALAIVACTAPLLDRITGPEAARNE